MAEAAQFLSMAGLAPSMDIVLGGGCFWCLDAVYRQMKGVSEVTSGYAGGRTPDPSYEAVCSGRTGHAEVVRVAFDESELSLREVLEVFFSIHDPTTRDRQGADVGTQYRSVVFGTPEQLAVAREVANEVQSLYDDPIVTEFADAGTFWPAEEYHQDYFANNEGQGYCRAVVAPKVAKFRKGWEHLLA